MTETRKILESRDADAIIGALRQLSEDTAGSFAEHRGLPFEHVTYVSGTRYLTASIHSHATPINNGDIIVHSAGTRFMVFDVDALPASHTFEVAMVISDVRNGIGHARKPATHSLPYLAGANSGVRRAAPAVLPGTRYEI